MSDPRVRRGTARLRQLRQRLRSPERTRLRRVSLGRLLPNVLTMLGLCAGLTAIRFGMEGRFGAAALSIAVAAAIDGIDGRLARLLRVTSRFGAEFDSLSDFLSFGVAPALVLWLWSLQRAGGYGFVPSLLFAVCMALRLARFNAMLDAPPKASESRAASPKFSVGVPAPAGAGLVLFPLFVALEARSLGWNWLEAAMSHPIVSAFVLTGTAGLLVSTLPVWSGKGLKLSRVAALPVLLGSGLFAAFLVADPFAALAVAGAIYAASLPLARIAAKRAATSEGLRA